MTADLPQTDPEALAPDPVIETPLPVEMKRRVTLIEMIWTMYDEAERIENAQAALVRAGLRKEPHAGQMARAHVLRSGANLLADIEHNWTDIRALIVAKRKKKRGRA